MTDAERKAVEAGHGVIWKELEAKNVDECREAAMRAALEAAIASGALVPASAVAEMRERCAKEADRAAERDVAWAIKYPDESRRCEERELRAKTISTAIRQLDLSPACGEYVVVPREPSEASLNAARDWSRESGR